MRKIIYNSTGDEFLREENATPECSEDFCEDCGDCLHCHESDDCGGEEGKTHRWIKYEDEPSPAIVTPANS